MVDGGWKTCGIVSEISALIVENVFKHLKAPIKRVTLPDVPAPASCVLENVYYRKSKDIIQTIEEVFKGN